MAIVNTARRLYVRGNLAVFQVSFFNDAAHTSPMVPQDALRYPSYTIFDIENQPVQSGVGQAVNSPGMYKAEFLVPTDALLSNDLQRWRIEWTMVTVDLRQVDFVEEFDVKDVVITASETREQRFIIMMGRDYRTSLRLGYQPLEVEVAAYGGGNLMNKVYAAALGSGVNVSTDGDSLVFYSDVPSRVLPPGSTTSVIWSTRSRITDPFQDVGQQVNVITPGLLDGITSVRQVIDKFQKRLGTVQAYEDSDIAEYLKRGQELVNAMYPTTFYMYGFLPQLLGVFHILFSSWYALGAQRLLETDLGVNFSGQTVTLDYDHAGQLGDQMSKWEEFINKNLPPAKMAIVRATAAVGTTAGRGYRPYQPMFTYKVASTNQFQIGGLASQLTTLGLLW